ncbi:MAG: hypothetical protein K2I88_04630 [Anaeroplasmataceae bacterium]|nr:hypothetical protein [Anaeroplasmataceae bacterium]
MSKKVKEEEFVTGNKPSALDKLSKIPSWLIILLLKYWAAAAAVFFSLIGGLSIGLDFSETGNDSLSVLSTDIVIIVILGLFMGLFMNYMIRPVVNMMYSRKNNTHRFNMVNIKGIVSLFANLGYHLIISIILFFITVFVLSPNGLVLDLFGTAGNAGIEPFTYALSYIFLDFVFLFIRNTIIDTIKRIKYNKAMKAGL